MPQYEYKCTKCGANFEARNNIDGRQFSTCGSCGGIGCIIPSVNNFSFGWVRTWNRPGDKEGDRLVKDVGRV